MFKAILSDLDGTLIDYDEHYQPEIKDLIQKIQAKSVTFSLATGRAYYGAVKRIEQELGIQGTHILHGGAFIYDSKTDTVLWNKPISAQSAHGIVEDLFQTHLKFGIEKENKVFISEPMKIPKIFSGVPHGLISTMDRYDDILKFLIFGFANSLTEQETYSHIQTLEKKYHDITLVPFQLGTVWGFDITSEEATKHTAVLELIKSRNLKKEDVIGIGDGHNDYPLLTACGYKIAMENAPTSVKEIADLVVPTVQKGGMKIALEHILKLV